MEVSGQRTAQATLSSALIHTCGWVVGYADLDTIMGGKGGGGGSYRQPISGL